MTAPRQILVVALLTAAAALVAAPAAATSAAGDSPWPQLRSSIQSLFSPSRRSRAGRKTVRPKVVSRTVAEPPISRQAAAKLPAKVPWPRPRPLEATAPHDQSAALAPAENPASEAQPPAAPAAPPAPSACQLRLTPDIALLHVLAPTTGPGECGAEDVVRLDGVVLKDGRRVLLAPAATLRCPMAETVVKWMREDVAQAAAELGSAVRTLVTAASYDCRGRNRLAGTKLSEHGRANALDLRGLTLANGTVADFTDTGVAKGFRERVRQSACARFMTVLGPGSDGYHEKHVHLDLAERRHGHRMCQWDVSPPAAVASVPMPPERPAALIRRRPAAGTE